MLPLQIVLVEAAGHDRVEHPLQRATFRVHEVKPAPLLRHYHSGRRLFVGNP